jgi:predicted metal-dependent hydrolase
MNEIRCTLTVDGQDLEARIVRKRVRNVNARLVGNELRVSAPPSVPQAELDALVLKLARRLVRRARAHQLNAGDEALILARKIASRFSSPPQVSDIRFVTTQKSRWGSYSRRTGIVRINAGLRMLPPWVLEAVVAHELAHAFHPDHSAAFWALLREVCPDTDRARAFLSGVSWIAQRWQEIPPVERSLLAGGSSSCDR